MKFFYYPKRTLSPSEFEFSSKAKLVRKDDADERERERE